tara:strand:- start:116 stop:355 length:240 start_codon:yes stop_codon:yes gene_type:complete
MEKDKMIPKLASWLMGFDEINGNETLDKEYYEAQCETLFNLINKEHKNTCDHRYHFQGGMRGAVSCDTGICGRCLEKVN